MTNTPQNSSAPHKSGGHSAFSRWMQHKMNGRMNRKVRAGKAKFMGMDVLILHTVGRRSGQPRETPVSWFPGGDNVWLIVASGGKDGYPDWHLNLMGNPEQATVELPGKEPVAVIPQVLEGAERADAWEEIVTVQPRYAKYQKKSDLQFPVVRLIPR